jgi:uncharacterized protein
VEFGRRRVNERAPLLTVFELLRPRIPRLGVAEYLLALRALEAGFGTGSRARLHFLCQTLWAKSAEEQQLVADVLDGVLPRPLTDADLDLLNEEIREPHPPPETPPDSGPAARPQRPRAPRAPSVPEPPSREPGGSTPQAAGPTASLDARILPSSPGLQRWSLQLRPAFDLTGSLPVTHRQMSRAWRSYRRMGRQGAPTEFDVEATLQRLHREGVLVEPVLVPPRTNRARALILEDVGGSMIPFGYLTRALVHAARHAGLARVEVRYFHDVPVEVVFADSARLDPLALEEVAAPYVDAGVLIYSDAGAARGALDEVRVERTERLLELLRRYTPAIAWLNPVPRERWAGSTAQAIRERCFVPMFPLDRSGLQAAVDVMRGRAS